MVTDSSPGWDSVSGGGGVLGAGTLAWDSSVADAETSGASSLGAGGASGAVSGSSSQLRMRSAELLEAGSLDVVS